MGRGAFNVVNVMNSQKEPWMASADSPSECTSFAVGRKHTADGSWIYARSEDWHAMEAKRFEIYPSTSQGPARFEALDSPFKCDLPAERLGYTALAPYHLPGHWGSAGFNAAGVGMSATESIFSNEKALAADPFVAEGLAENSVFNVVLPYIHSARGGAEYLGSLIEKYGTAESFGIGFIDSKEVWYLESAGGHRWMAARIPDDKYFVTGNQGRLRDYDPNDKKNYLGAADLIDFAVKNGLWDGAVEKFDFHEAYMREAPLDHTYNYPRVWGIQGMLSPNIKNDVTKNTFPVYARAEHDITLDDVRRVFRFHYNGTEHDPYLNCNPKEEYRPVSIFRTTQTHILQVRPELPAAIGCVNYVCQGMAALGVFLPLYQGIQSFPKPYTVANGHSSADSAYWIFRKPQTLAMTNFNRYAKLVQDTYARLEHENDARMRELEEQYLKIYKSQPYAAQEMLQAFSDAVLLRALEVTNTLVEELYSRMALDIHTEYNFHGA